MISTMTFIMALAVGLGGALGAVARYLLDAYLPGGLLIANALGCLLLGGLYGALEVWGGSGQVSGWLPEPVLAFLSIGLIGTLTTFATVSLQAAQLWMRRLWLSAVGLWLAHATAGLTAALLGIWLGSTGMGMISGIVVVDIY